jgi:VanZ family protein
VARRAAILLAGLGLALLSLLLILGSDEALPSRAFRAFWNLGHVGYFALIAGLLLQWPGLRRQAPWRQWLLVLLATLLIGGTIEILQIGTRRSADWMDLLRDFAGSLLVLAFHPGLQGGRALLRKGLRLLVLALLLWEALPFGRALVNTVATRQQFPVLADFSTPFELDRWSGGADRRIVEAEGRRLLELTLRPGAYSGVSLQDFPADWSGYGSLVIELEQPSPEPLRLTLRIHDRLHETGPHAYDYSDRFNRSFVLEQGRQRLRIPLQQIRKAPSRRLMDLRALMDLSMFAMDLPRPRKLRILTIRLEPG